jgi:hypothetical protein
VNEAVDDFEVESNSSESTAPVEAPAVETRVSAPAETDLEVVDEAPARDRDEQGRYKASAKPDDAEDIDEKPADPKPAKPRDDPQARVQQAVTRQREAERRADAAERRAQELEAKTQPRQERPEERQAPQTPRFPRFEQWLAQNPQLTHDDYLDARDDFRDGQREQQTSQQRQQFEAQRERDQVNTAFKSKLDAAITKDAHFLAAVSEDVLSIPTFAALRQGERPTPLHFLGEELLRADDPEALMRYWTAHPDTFQRYATLPPRAITRQLAKDETLASSTAARTGPASKAPAMSTAKPPMPPVIGSPHASGDDPPDPNSDDFDAHKRFYDAKDRKARAGR